MAESVRSPDTGEGMNQGQGHPGAEGMRQDWRQSSCHEPGIHLGSPVPRGQGWGRSGSRGGSREAGQTN